MKYILNRDVTTDECPWLEETIAKGMPVTRYTGPTYGCIDVYNGVAVTMSEVSNETPFFELPYSALMTEDGQEVISPYINFNSLWEIEND